MGLTLTIFALTGCAPVKFYSNPGLTEKTGLKYYMVKPYLMVERDTENNRVVKVTVIYLPDLLDYTQDQKEIKALSKKLGIGTGKMKAATSVDLRQWCSPVENQGKLGSCTAHAGNR